MFPQAPNHFYGNGHESQFYDQSNDYHQQTDAAKTDRRQWNKSNKNFNLEYPDHEMVRENQKRYDDYLFNLHINNQILKMANKKDEKVEKLEKLEGGFSLYVNGAHKSSEKYTPRHTTASKSSTDKKKNFNFTPRIHIRKNPVDNLKQLAFLEKKDRSQSAPNKPNRKKWSDNSNMSFTIKTTDGYEIKINAPNEYKPKISKSDATSNKKSHDYEYCYSDDFASESDSEEKITKNESNGSKGILQSVKFSDDSDLEVDSDNEIYQSKPDSNVKSPKKLFVKLSNKDIRTLRQSINDFEATVVKDSLDISTVNEEKYPNKSQFMKSSFLSGNKKKSSTQIAKNVLEESCIHEEIIGKELSSESESDDEIAENLNDNDEESPSVCDLIIKNLTNLKPSDRENLVKFLTNIESTENSSNRIKANKLNNKT